MESKKTACNKSNIQERCITEMLMPCTFQSEFAHLRMGFWTFLACKSVFHLFPLPVCNVWNSSIEKPWLTVLWPQSHSNAYSLYLSLFIYCPFFSGSRRQPCAWFVWMCAACACVRLRTGQTGYWAEMHPEGKYREIWG